MFCDIYLRGGKMFINLLVVFSVVVLIPYFVSRVVNKMDEESKNLVKARIPNE
jgi:hypothetical protein